MADKRYKTGGWFNESYRHSLASRGIRTAKYLKRKDRLADRGIYRNFDADDISEQDRFPERSRNIYQEKGFPNRRAYLQSLSDEYDVPLDVVMASAQLLGPNEDFDGLVSSLQDYKDIFGAHSDMFDEFGTVIDPREAQYIREYLKSFPGATAKEASEAYEQEGGNDLFSRKFFAKGNRMPTLVAVGHAQGFEDDQLKGNRELLYQFIEGSPERREWPQWRKDEAVAESIFYLENKGSETNLPSSTSVREERAITGFSGSIPDQPIPTIEPPALDLGSVPMSIPPAPTTSLPSSPTTSLPGSPVMGPAIGGNEETIMTPGVPERNSPLDFDDALAYTARKARGDLR